MRREAKTLIALALLALVGIGALSTMAGRYRKLLAAGSNRDGRAAAPEREPTSSAAGKN